MRVSLPVDPYWKTASEVATLDFVRQKTDIPVPNVIASDASHDNELGFEWILMELMPGKPYADKWKTLPWTSKEAMVKRLAQYSAELFRIQSEDIGNIYHVKGPSRSSSKDGFEVGRIITIPFFWEKRLEQDVPRGPFRRGRDWLAAHLCFPRNDSDLVLSKPRQDGMPLDSDDEDELEDAKAVKGLVDRLFLRLQWLFPPPDYEKAAEVAPERTVLVHDDVNMSNVLVDDDGNMIALVDWECVSVLPLWRACQFPKFLQSRTRDEEPDPDDYEGPLEESDLYWEDLMEYEQTRLRHVFLEGMKRLEPSWVSLHHQSALKQDFEDVIGMSYDRFTQTRVGKWLDEVDAGVRCTRLREEQVSEEQELLD